jgi:hypothetical protein
MTVEVVKPQGGAYARSKGARKSGEAPVT